MLHFSPPRPPWTTLGKKLESGVRKALFEFDLIQEKKIGVALSGGKDSLTLLFLLKAISDGGPTPFDLTVFHVAGTFSCGPGIDSSYLRRICEALDLPLIVKKNEHKLEELKCYSCSRERRKLLFDAAKENGIQTIAFGHHQDDVVETLLMNLLHKAEFASLLPKLKMQRYGVTIIRPLIYIQEREIESFAQLYGFRRISCQCPVGVNSKRQKTKELIQALEDHFPNAKTNLFQAGQNDGLKKANQP